jgi:hypothetical protein
MGENQEHLETTPETEPTPVGWAFWFQWVLATAAGSLLGLVVAAAVLFIPVMTLGIFVNFEALPTWIVMFVSAGSALGGAAVGTTVGIAQRFILRRHDLQTRHWILASVVGRIVGGYAAAVFALTVCYGGTNGAIVAVLLLDGAVVGLTQWLVLHRWLKRAGWWILASTVGHFSLGTVTGGTLVWLLRQSSLPGSDKVQCHP